MVIRPLAATDFRAVHAAFNAAFLEHCGATRFVRQLEMVRAL
jgi:hypothetical protein